MHMWYNNRYIKAKEEVKMGKDGNSDEAGSNPPAPEPEPSAAESYPEQTKTPKGPSTMVSHHIRLSEELSERAKALSNYAAQEGYYPSDPRGNLSNFIGWCITLGDQILEHRAKQKRGLVQ